jgi:hypothetical protein
MSKVQPILRKFLFESQVLGMSTACEFELVDSTTMLVGIEALPSDSLGNNGQTSSHNSNCVLIEALNVDPKPCLEPEIVVLDPAKASPSHELAKKRKESYELNRHFQDSWDPKLPWIEDIVGMDGMITQVCYKVCFEVEKREKLLVSKIDLLWKHGGGRLWWTWQR